MTIYERTKRGRPVNPALALYEFWHSILTGVQTAGPERNAEGRLFGVTSLGSRAWSLGFENQGSPDTPNISYGHTFHLTHEGEFQLAHPHGTSQREILAENTFLEWSYWRGYNWFVGTDHTFHPPWHERHGGAVKDWRNPRHYVHEHVLGARRWDRPWMKLKWSDESGWHIVFSKPTDKSAASQVNGITQDTFDRFEALRQKRYRLMERAEKIATGEWSVENRRVVTQQERQERNEKTLTTILAHLDVSQPARTVSLRRNREEGLWPAQPGAL